jgi:hypothetical protein
MEEEGGAIILGPDVKLSDKLYELKEDKLCDVEIMD